MLLRLDKVLNGHVYNVELAENTPNGAIIEKGGYLAFDYYEGKAVANVDAELLLLATPFMDKTGLEDEATFTLKKGEIGRAYALNKGDMITMTIDGITGATAVSADMVDKFAVPEVGSFNLKIDAVKSGSLAFEVKAVEQINGKDALVLELK